MDFELLTYLLKFIEHFPDYLSVFSRMLLRFFWTTFVETAVYREAKVSLNYSEICAVFKTAYAEAKIFAV